MAGESRDQSPISTANPKPVSVAIPQWADTVRSVIETVAIKISSKTQKKFAILTIGDGFDRFELPIWPEMFEQKGPLVRENQLFYAILQVERKTESLHLQCRYFDDLTAVDEAKLRECDEIYDRLKAQTRHSESKWKSAPKPQQPPQDTSLVRLKVNADELRFSGILALKNLFRQHPGKSPLEVHFLGSTKRWGTLHIDSEWGVKADAPFREKISALSEKLGTQIECM